MERSEGPSLPTQPAPIATPVAAPAAAPTMMQAGLEPAAVQSQPAPVAAPTTAPAAAPTMQAEAKPEKPVAMVAPGSGCATVKWTDDAIDRLEIAMQAADTGGQGIDWEEVSKQVGRTPSACSTRALHLGLKQAEMEPAAAQSQLAPIAAPVATPAGAPMIHPGAKPGAVQSRPCKRCKRGAGVCFHMNSPGHLSDTGQRMDPEKTVAMVAPGSGGATVKWTDDDINLLEIAMHAPDTGGQGIDWDQVSKQVGRTPSAYSTRALRQGLKPGAKQSDSRGLTPSDLSPAKEIRFGGARPEAALDSMYSK